MGYIALITIKNWNPRNEFKKWIKLWKVKVFPFSIWKTRIIQVGFIWSFIHATLMRDNYKSSLTEAVVQTFSVKKVLLESSQNSRENTCARVSFLIKKKLWHWCFAVNFTKFLRIPFLTEHLHWLLLFKALQSFLIENLTHLYLSQSHYCSSTWFSEKFNEAS